MIFVCSLSVSSNGLFYYLFIYLCPTYLVRPIEVCVGGARGGEPEGGMPRQGICCESGWRQHMGRGIPTAAPSPIIILMGSNAGAARRRDNEIPTAAPPGNGNRATWGGFPQLQRQATEGPAFTADQSEKPPAGWCGQYPTQYLPGFTPWGHSQKPWTRLWSNNKVPGAFVRLSGQWGKYKMRGVNAQ